MSKSFSWWKIFKIWSWFFLTFETFKNFLTVEKFILFLYCWKIQKIFDCFIIAKNHNKSSINRVAFICFLWPSTHFILVESFKKKIFFIIFLLKFSFVHATIREGKIKFQSNSYRCFKTHTNCDTNLW